MAFLFFFERKKRILNLFMERNALSDAEKIIERIIRMLTAMSNPVIPSKFTDGGSAGICWSFITVDPLQEDLVIVRTYLMLV